MAWGLKGGGGAIALRPNEGKGQRADASSKPALSADPELLEEVAKLALNTAQRGRAMEGVLFTYWIVPRNHEIVEAMDGKGREYATAVEGKADEHGFGTPDIHTWAALIKFLAATDKLKEERRSGGQARAQCCSNI